MGIWQEGKLIALAFARLGTASGSHSYALRTGAPTAEGTLDFCDVMVDAAWRRQGIHKAIHQFVMAMAKANGCHAIYCTVDPANIPSRSSFEHQGYRAICEKQAYDGRPRVYYQLTL